MEGSLLQEYGSQQMKVLFLIPIGVIKDDFLFPTLMKPI